MTKFSKIAAAVAMTLSFGAANASLVIDSFSAPQIAQTTDNTTNGQAVFATQVMSSDILGGYRDLFVSKEGDSNFDPQAGVTGNVITLNDGQGIATYNEQSGQKGLAMIRWDGVSTGIEINQGGLGNIDLTAFGSAFKVDLLDSDANTPLTLRVWTLVEEASYLFSSVRIDANDAGSYFFNFSEFGNADFTQVGAIELQINGAGINDLDAQIDMVSVVPEPGTLALAGIALMGLGAIRRRKS